MSSSPKSSHSSPAITGCAPRGTDDALWFSSEVQLHEPLLRNYIKGNFPAIRDVDDVVQESYLRILKARASKPLRSAKAFLFQIARHLAIDLVRRDRISPLESVRNLESLAVIEEKSMVSESLSLEEKTALLIEALAELPDRCREIVVLRKLEGLSQREVAERLGLSERTIEVQVSRGVKRCEAFLRKRGLDSFSGS